MQFQLYKVSGFEEAIMSLRMSKGKFSDFERAQQIQDLVYVCTDRTGRLADPEAYYSKLRELKIAACPQEVVNPNHAKIKGWYSSDIDEFKRLLGLTMDNAMGEKAKHHTLMKYIDISFLTYGLHRGAQDDLDAHAIAFNNRITRFSTRLAEIPEAKLSEWYQDKLISFHDAHHIILSQALQNYDDTEESDTLISHVANDTDTFQEGTAMPRIIEIGQDEFHYTPFGYMLKRFAEMSPKSGLYKDVARGGMPIGMESNGIWKTDLFNLRYIYHMRSKLTKANPELKAGMEQLADQIEAAIPVFGPRFRQVFTDSKSWVHTNLVRTVTKEEYEMLMRMKGAHCPSEEDGED